MPGTATTYEIAFERVGRNRAVAPLTARASDADDLAFKVFRYVKPMLASRDVDVTVDLEAGTVQIFCGWNNGGSGTIKAVES